MTKYGPYDPRYPNGELPDGSPSFTIREDQEWKIQRALAEPTQGVLIADDMGKGKTLMACEMIVRSAAWNRVLIVGIRDTGKQWAEQLADQSDGKIKLRLMNSTVTGQKNWEAFMAGEAGVYYSGIQWFTYQDWEVIEKKDHRGQSIPVIDKKTGLPTGKVVTQSVHKDLFRRRLNTKMRHIDAVFFDEIHKMQSRKSQTAMTMTSFPSDWRIGLSGTFMGNKFEGAWKVCRWIWPKLIDTSFVRWRRRWAALKPIVKAGGGVVKGFGGEDAEKVVGELVEGEFVKTLPCYIRDEPDPVPPARIVKVKMTPEQWEQYRSIESISMAWLESHHGGQEPMIADLPITQRQRLRTATLAEMRFDEEMRVSFDLEAQSAKLNTIRFIIDNLWKNMPILIGAYSVDWVNIATARLQRAGYGAVAWHGGITPTRRQEIKAKFIARDPAYRYLICTIPSIGTGTDGLQKACSKLIWAEESESQIDNEQFVKRAFRPGMTLDYGIFEHVKLVAEGTIDEGILARHDAQSRSMRASLRAS